MFWQRLVILFKAKEILSNAGLDFSSLKTVRKKDVNISIRHCIGKEAFI